MRIDSWGLPITGGDGGDALNKYFTFQIRRRLYEKATGIPYRDIPELPLPLFALEFMFSESPGILRRHVDPNFWGSYPWNVSRDQMVAVISYLALKINEGDLYGSYSKNLRAILWQTLKRGMFAQNQYNNWVDPRTDKTAKKKMPDFLSPEVWGMFARGFWPRFGPMMLPIILFGDLFLLLSAMIKVWAPITRDGSIVPQSQGPDDVDDDNMHNMLMVTQNVVPTPLSWLARKIFVKFRKDNYGNLGKMPDIEATTDSAVQGALNWYHRPDAGGNIELAEIAGPIVEKY